MTGEESVVMYEVVLPWHYLVCGGLHFEQEQYSAEIFYLSDGPVLRVHAVSLPDKELEYSLSTTKIPTYALKGVGGGVCN